MYTKCEFLSHAKAQRRREKNNRSLLPVSAPWRLCVRHKPLATLCLLGAFVCAGGCGDSASSPRPDPRPSADSAEEIERVLLGIDQILQEQERREQQPEPIDRLPPCDGDCDTCPWRCESHATPSRPSARPLPRPRWAADGFEDEEEDEDDRTPVERVELPEDQRWQNWRERGQGSCIWACACMLLESIGRPDLAEQIAQTQGGGASDRDLHRLLDECGLDYVTSRAGDWAVLHWAGRTGRAAVVTLKCGRGWKGGHVCVLLHVDPRIVWDEQLGRFVPHPDPRAVVIDPNSPGQIENWPLDKFLDDWRGGFPAGWVTVLTESPNPPALEG